MTLQDDEQRLMQLFRCLTAPERSDLMIDVASRLMQRYFPNKNVYDFMPSAAGISPRKDGSYMTDTGSIDHILFSGLEATGEPERAIFGASDWDTDQVIPRFAAGAGQAALEQGGFFNYDAQFASEYLPEWRWAVVWALVSCAKE